MSTPLARRSWLAATLLGLAAVLAPAAQAATTTGSGKSATEAREASGFAAIAMRGDIDIVVRQAAREAVQVSADDNLLPLLQTVVEGSGEQRTLRIQWKSGESIRTKSRTVVTVDVVKLTAVSLSGSGDLALGALKTPSFALSISGSSDAKIEQLDSGQLSVSISGSGDVQASGKASKLEVSISGSGDVRLRELATEDASVSIAGSGDASVNASKALAVSIAGSGDVEYTGGAMLAKARVAGSGSIRQR
jgi:hypothetical protein